jgi:hypothetical protein
MGEAMVSHLLAICCRCSGMSAAPARSARHGSLRRSPMNDDQSLVSDIVALLKKKKREKGKKGRLVF